MVWIGIFFLSFVWLFALPQYEPIQGTWVIFLLCGIAANIKAFWGTELPPIPRTLVWLVIPSLSFAMALFWPFNLGAMLLVLALVIALASQRYPKVRPVVFGLGLSGLVLLIQAMVWPGYVHLAARLHTIPLVDQGFAWLVNLLGGTARYNQGALFLKTVEGLSRFTSTWEGLGMSLLVSIAAGGSVLLAFSKDVWNNFFKLLATLMGYAILRYLLLLFALISFETPDVFWRRPWLVLSFFPLSFILLKWLPLNVQSVEWPAWSWSWKTVTAGVLASLSVFLLCSAVLFQDPGIKKQGRVLFDEGHSDWEWMDKAFDTEWYGETSSYNYYSLGQFLKHYYSVDIKREPLTPDLLNRYDVLVLKTPTAPYTSDEVAAVTQFVKAGGGLFLIGDHTNVFGMSTYLNQVASPFNFSFKYDSTYDLSNGNLSFYEPPSVVRHPVLNQLPFYMFATSCSLQAPLLSEDVIIGYGLKGLNADYSQKSFFPKDSHDAPAMEFGSLLQMAGSKQGEGRVLLYTDSTCFSNFYMFMPGKPELFLGSLEWLNRKNRYHWVNFWLVILAGVTLVATVPLIRHAPRFQIMLFGLAAVLLGSAVGVGASHTLNYHAYPSPAIDLPYTKLSFDTEHSRAFVPARQLSNDGVPDLHTFYVWTQRIGLLPNVSYNFQETLAQSDAIVLANPTKPFTPQEIDALTSFVERGGKLLVMDDPRNLNTSTSYQVLRPFGMYLECYEIPQGNVVNQAGEPIWNGSHLGEIRGGEPLLFINLPEAGLPDHGTTLPNSKAETHSENLSQPKHAVFSVARRGKGMVAALGCSHVFTTPVMGTTSTVPTEDIRKVYGLEYWILRDVLGLHESKP